MRKPLSLAEIGSNPIANVLPHVEVKQVVFHQMIAVSIHPGVAIEIGPVDGQQTIHHLGIAHMLVHMVKARRDTSHVPFMANVGGIRSPAQRIGAGKAPEELAVLALQYGVPSYQAVGLRSRMARLNDGQIGLLYLESDDVSRYHPMKKGGVILDKVMQQPRGMPRALTV